MSDINQAIRARRDVIKNAGRALKPVDTALEAIERRIRRINQFRTKVPNRDDLDFLRSTAKEMQVAMEMFDQILDGGFEV